MDQTEKIVEKILSLFPQHKDTDAVDLLYIPNNEINQIHQEIKSLRNQLNPQDMVAEFVMLLDVNLESFMVTKHFIEGRVVELSIQELYLHRRDF